MSSESKFSKEKAITETFRALLVEFHEHELKRVPDLQEGLVEVAKDRSVQIPKEFDHNLEACLDADSAGEEHTRKVLIQYKEEAEKVDSQRLVMRQSALKMLSRHALEGTRPVTLQELEIHLEAIDRRFEAVQVTLKQFYKQWIERMTDGEEDLAARAGSRTYQPRFSLPQEGLTSLLWIRREPRGRF